MHMQVQQFHLFRSNRRWDHSQVYYVWIQIECPLGKGVWEAGIVFQLPDESPDVILPRLQV